MTKTLRIGYIPLVDSALLHVARAYDFAAAEGLDLDLVRETSWANVRDKLCVGIFDAAHMLAPSVIAVSLGLGYIEMPLVAPVALGLDGNAITLSVPLYNEVHGFGGSRCHALCDGAGARNAYRKEAGFGRGTFELRACLSLFDASLSIAALVRSRRDRCEDRCQPHRRAAAFHGR